MHIVVWYVMVEEEIVCLNADIQNDENFVGLVFIVPSIGTTIIIGET